MVILFPKKKKKTFCVRNRILCDTLLKTCILIQIQKLQIKWQIKKITKLKYKNKKLNLKEKNDNNIVIEKKLFAAF